MDSKHIYIEHYNLPLLKINSDKINDYVIINDKFNKYIVNKGDIVIGTSETCGKIKIVQCNKAYYTDHLLKFIDLQINKMYLYYNLLLILDENTVNSMTNGSVIQFIRKEKLENLKIKVPKNKQLITDLEPIFQQIETLQNEIKIANDLFDQYIQELKNDSTSIEIQQLAQIDDSVSVASSSKSSKSVTIATLIEQCRSLGRKNYSGKTKDQLLQIIASEEPIVFEKKIKQNTVDYYKKICKDLGIKGYSGKKKDELIKLIDDHKSKK